MQYTLSLDSGVLVPPLRDRDDGIDGPPGGVWMLRTGRGSEAKMASIVAWADVDAAETASPCLRQVVAAVEVGSWRTAVWSAAGREVAEDGVLSPVFWRIMASGAKNCFAEIMLLLLWWLALVLMACCKVSDSSLKYWPVKGKLPTCCMPQVFSILMERWTPLRRTLYGSSSAGISGTMLPLLREMKKARRGGW